MNQNAQELLAKLNSPFSRGNAQWGDISLTVDYYETSEQPAYELVSSVRGIVLKEGNLLAICDRPNHYHIVPGGRVEDGETIEQTLVREIGEETGWTFKNPSYIGLIHFQYQSPKPEKSRFPYPDFFHLLFVVEADEHQPSALLDNQVLQDEYVLFSQWVSVSEAKALDMDVSQHRLLKIVFG